MHYQSKLMPISDDDGRFLLAICHGEQTIGGEDSRETQHARFFAGQVSQLHKLRELSSICLPPRPASAAAAKHQRVMAKSQGELARSGSYGAAMSENYSANERAMLHAAALAEVQGVRVPRLVHASRRGTALLAYEPSLRALYGEDLPGTMRLIDVGAGVTLRDWSSSRAPLDRPRGGIERISSVALGRPLGLSRDGTRVLLFGGAGEDFCIVECALDAGLTEIAATKHSARHFTSITTGWLAVAGETLQWLAPGLQRQLEAAIPRGALGWSYRASPDGALAAMSTTTGGDIWLLTREGGKPRRFSPHRGVGRDAYLTLAISDCGRWIASRCENHVVVTRLEDGVSWPVAELADRKYQDSSIGGFVVHSHVPATLGFVGSHLLLAEDGVVTEVNLDVEGAKAFVSEHGRPGARKPIRVKPAMAFDALLAAARLQQHEVALRRLHSPAVAIKTKPLKKAGWLLPGRPNSPELGTSRFGGWPDLPADVTWPRWQDRPMAFIAQINLAEAHASEPGLRLPSAGLLSFFLGCMPDTYEKQGDPRSRYMVDLMASTEVQAPDAWVVMHHQKTDDLQRRLFDRTPLPELFEPCSVRFVRGGLTLPDELTMAYPLLTRAMTEAERDDYNELVGQLKPDNEYSSEQLMGYPELIQGTPPELMCELSARGQNPWTYPDPASQEFTDLATSASEWTLLLQLTSNSDADFCWGDAGHLYFYGDRAAMERGDFSKVWVNFEN